MQCGRDRERLAEVMAHWKRPLVWIDRAAQGVSYLKAHPLLVASVVAGFGLIRGRGGAQSSPGKSRSLWRWAKPLLAVALPLVRKL